MFFAFPKRWFEQVEAQATFHTKNKPKLHAELHKHSCAASSFLAKTGAREARELLNRRRYQKNMADKTGKDRPESWNIIWMDCALCVLIFFLLLNEEFLITAMWQVVTDYLPSSVYDPTCKY